MSDSTPLERDIVKAIQAHLKRNGIWHVKIHGGGFQTIGLPDLVCIVSGRFVGLEVKRPRLGRLTQMQAAVIDRINAAGGYARVVTSVEDVVRALEDVRAGSEKKTGG